MPSGDPILGVPAIFIAAAVLLALVLAVILAPGWGLRARVRAVRAFRLRVRVEDALKHVYGAAERGRRASIESLAGALGMPARHAASVARLLHERGLASTAEGLVLTPAGERVARQIVRAHRVWERYLADELRAPSEELHHRADRREHYLTREDVDYLAAHLGHPQHDPHGDPIPPVDQRPEPAMGWPVTLMPSGMPAEIVHLEDEPTSVFTRLAALQLEPGQRVVVRATAADRVVLEVDGRRHELSPVDAANIFVVPAVAPARAPARTLADLRVGEGARLRRVGINGFARRRLFDLGFTPGARVACAFPAAFGEPRAYRVRGTLIALRPEQARRIEVELLPEAEAP